MNKSHLLINEPPLVVSPRLACAIGLNEALVIQQLHYWLNNAKSEGRTDEEGNKWIYNTYEEWQENFPFWSTDKIQRIFLKLEELGVVIARQLDAKKRDMKKFYRIDYDKLCMMDDAILRPSNTAKLHDVNNESETTTESTPKAAKKSKFRDATWDLLHGEMPSEEGLQAARLAEQYKDIADRLSSGLRRGEFPQSTDAQAVYRWIAEREGRGQSLKTFIAWAMDGRRAEFSFIYHKDPKLIKRDWLQVFPSDNAEVATPDEDGGFR